ncbi:hypothetical protein ABW20_dc0101713 [Dactylellina cionopaga]|nr:hypothetical protein ABW20_dc0101713 [Dactylellina cionopaga]
MKFTVLYKNLGLFALKHTLILYSPINAASGQDEADIPRIAIPMSTWASFRKQDWGLRESLMKQIDGLQVAQSTCQVGNKGIQSRELFGSLNLLINAAEGVWGFLNTVIGYEQPGEAGYSTINQVQLAAGELGQYIEQITALKQNHLDAFQAVKDMKGTMYQQQMWMYFCKLDSPAKAVYCVPDGPQRRIAQLQSVFDAAEPAIELANDAADWARRFASTEQIDKILWAYNLDDPEKVIKSPQWRGQQDGTPTTGTSDDQGMDSLEALFIKIAEWFDCWREPIPKIVALVEELSPLPQVEA